MKRYVDALERNKRARAGLAPEVKAQAEKVVREGYPTADAIEIRQYGDLVYAEVWQGKSAQIVGVRGLVDA